MEDQAPAFSLIAAAIIVGLMQAVKTAGLPSRWAPLASIALGELLALAYVMAGEMDWLGGLVLGLVAGLTASGLYSGQKAVRGD